MDSHQKKKKKTIQSKSKINPRSRRWQRKPNIVYTEQKKTKPHYPILQYKFVYPKKKKTQYRANQTPNPEKTKPTVRRSHRSQAQLAPSLVILVQSLSLVRPLSLLRACPSLSLVACPSSQIVDRRSQISLGCSDARPQGISLSFSLSVSDPLSLSLSLSLSHSLTKMKNMNV